MRKLLLLSLFSIISSGCVHITVPETEACTVAGDQTAGAFCAKSISGSTRNMNLDEWIEFITPQLERPDPEHAGQVLPARGGAVCQSELDYGRIKTTLEQACRELGNDCSYELKATIKTMEKIQARARIGLIQETLQ
jgi:hypothetical protein